MGTRANIARKNTDESFDVIYTHWDGYPSHHGPILLGHYNTDAKVAELLALGSLSVLGESIGRKHAFDRRDDGSICTAFGRDRGDANMAADHMPSPEAMKKYLDDSWTEWIYLWDVAHQAWFYTNNPSPTWFKSCGTEQRTLDRLENWGKSQEAVNA